MSAEQSPFGQALTHTQRLQYAIDWPGVLCVVPGVQTMEHLNTLLAFLTASDAEKDYSIIGTFTADACLHCGHCESRCPFGVKQMTRMEEICTYFN